MVFNSYAFALFFALLLPAYWLMARWPRAQNILLLGVSYYFYSRWDTRFLSLLILSTVMDYLCGLWVAREEDPRRRKAAVALSMALNLGMLGFFKYYNFFAESLHRPRWRPRGWSVSMWHLEVALPIGISFYTFQSMSYVIDVYRREIQPTRNLVQFAAFVSFFPHLVAGPIMRPTTLLPQITTPRRFDIERFYQGSYLIFWGLLKKVVVADNLGLIVKDLFGRWETLDGGLALLAVYAFAFQIYGDFSGYTDIARGVSKCLGFELSLNFNLPYFATSPRDFWTRWHISLSQWLRDYLYITLGGSRGGTARTYRNLMITMTLGGLWHGPAWTYVLWGVYHGALLVGAPDRRADPETDRPGRRRRPRLLEGPADHRHVPPGLPGLADVPRPVGGPGDGDARRDRAPALDPDGRVPGPRAGPRRPAADRPVDPVPGRRPRHHRPHPVVRPQPVLHGVLLRDRAGRQFRRPAIHLFSILSLLDCPGLIGHFVERNPTLKKCRVPLQPTPTIVTRVVPTCPPSSSASGRSIRPLRVARHRCYQFPPARIVVSNDTLDDPGEKNTVAPVERWCRLPDPT